MRTPGRCTNTEGCWISASQRNVWISVGEDFACPNCGGTLSPPLPETRSFRAVKRAATLGVAASVGLAVLGYGAVKLSTVSWPGQPVFAELVNAPSAVAVRGSGTKNSAPRQLAESTERDRPLTASAERRAAGEVAAAGPNSFLSMELASNAGPSARARLAAEGHRPGTSARMAVNAAPGQGKPAGPHFIYSAPGVASALESSAPQTSAAEGHKADPTVTETQAAPVTVVSQASFSPLLSMERPVILPISFGAPLGPETDAEPVTLAWRHHGLANVRRSGFLPAPPPAAPPASADAIAQICRIPSLLH